MIFQQQPISADLLQLLQRSLAIQELVISIISNAVLHSPSSYLQLEQPTWPQATPVQIPSPWATAADYPSATPPWISALQSLSNYQTPCNRRSEVNTLFPCLSPDQTTASSHPNTNATPVRFPSPWATAADFPSTAPSWTSAPQSLSNYQTPCNRRSEVNTLFPCLSPGQTNASSQPNTSGIFGNDNNACVHESHHCWQSPAPDSYPPSNSWPTDVFPSSTTQPATTWYFAEGIPCSPPQDNSENLLKSSTLQQVKDQTQNPSQAQCPLQSEQAASSAKPPDYVDASTTTDPPQTSKSRKRRIQDPRFQHDSSDSEEPWNTVHKFRNRSQNLDHQCNERSNRLELYQNARHRLGAFDYRRAREAAKALVRSPKSQRALREDVHWYRNMWRCVTDSRNYHPLAAPVSLIRTFHKLLEEEKRRSVIWDEECLDFAILKNRYDHKAYNATLQPAAKQSKHFRMLLTREQDARQRLQNQEDLAAIEIDRTLTCTPNRARERVQQARQVLQDNNENWHAWPYRDSKLLFLAKSLVLTRKHQGDDEKLNQEEDHQPCASRLSDQTTDDDNIPLLQSSSSSSGEDLENTVDSNKHGNKHQFTVPEVILRKTGLSDKKAFVCFAIFAKFVQDQNRGSLNIQSFTDIVCDQFLSQAASLISYMQNCSVPRDTIENVLKLKAQPEFKSVITVRTAMLETGLIGEPAMTMLNILVPLLCFSGVPNFQELTNQFAC